MNRTISFTTCVLALLLTFTAAAQVPGVESVVVIGVDGMSPDGVRKAKTPNLDALIAVGAHTFKARGVMPTSSSPNWASMIMGAGPEQHGVTSNDWEPDKFDIAPTVEGPGGIFPTIFSVIREQRPDANTAVFHDWGGYGRLFERELLSKIVDGDGPQDTTNQAVAYIKAERPTFTFIHLDHVDHAGHAHGHGTPEYYASVEVADRLIGEVVQALKDAGIVDSTLVHITSDHGGVGKGHGGATMAEIEIPWIWSGPGVAAGSEIAAPVDTYDTAATVAHVFGLNTPSAWIAKPATSAFK